MVVPTCNLSIQEAEAQRKRWPVPHSLEQLVRSRVNNNSSNNSSPPPEKSKQIRDGKGNLSKIKVTYGHYVSLLPGSFLSWLWLCLFLRQCPLCPGWPQPPPLPREQRPSASGFRCCHPHRLWPASLPCLFLSRRSSDNNIRPECFCFCLCFSPTMKVTGRLLGVSSPSGRQTWWQHLTQWAIFPTEPSWQPSLVLRVVLTRCNPSWHWT